MRYLLLLFLISFSAYAQKMSIEEINSLAVETRERELRQRLIIRGDRLPEMITRQDLDIELDKLKSELRSEVKREQFKDVYGVMGNQNTVEKNPALWLESLDEATIDQMLILDDQLYTAAKDRQNAEESAKNRARDAIRSFDPSKVTNVDELKLIVSEIVELLK